MPYCSVEAIEAAIAASQNCQDSALVALYGSAVARGEGYAPAAHVLRWPCVAHAGARTDSAVRVFRCPLSGTYVAVGDIHGLWAVTL
jgi:hypothetical protein